MQKNPTIIKPDFENSTRLICLNITLKFQTGKMILLYNKVDTEKSYKFARF